MRAILILFLLWAVGLSTLLPEPVLVILCAALGSGMAVTLWFAISHRRNPVNAVADGDAKSEFREKSR